MNSIRSMWKLFVGVAGLGLLVNNCTIKTDDSGSAGAGNTSSGSCSPVGSKTVGCLCTGNLKSYQVCTDDGTYSACVCDDVSGGGAASVAGATSYAGATTAAGATSYAGTGGYSGAGVDAAEAGAAGDGPLDISSDCYTCLTQLCSQEWGACAADNETTVANPGDPYCLSQSTSAAPGQMELIMACITNERAKGLVKRDVVRACGSTIGMSADPMFFVWAPQEMTPATEELINCMADAPDETNPGSWATDTEKNFPDSGPRPWDDMTCAKLACTSKL